MKEMGSYNLNLAFAPGLLEAPFPNNFFNGKFIWNFIWKIGFSLTNFPYSERLFVTDGRNADLMFSWTTTPWIV